MPSLAQNVSSLDRLREMVLGGANPFQVGLSFDQWNRVRKGGDWKLIEAGTGRPGTSWDGDRYGDTFDVPGAGTLTFEKPGVYVARTAFSHYRTFYWAQGIQFLRNLLGVPDDATLTQPPRRFYPHAESIPWATARILDFEIPAEVFVSDATSFIKDGAEDMRTAIMALMTAFANMSADSQTTHAALWDAIVLRLQSGSSSA